MPVDPIRTTFTFIKTGLLAALLLLTGCASMFDDRDLPENWSAERLYQEATEALKHEDYRFAIDYFEKLETRFPFGARTQQGMLMNAFAYYKSNDPESAIATADRFIKLYPTHPDIDYAFYIRGLAHFHSRDSFMDDLFNVDPAKRDPESVERSFHYFAELVERFPTSQYAPDARQRMQFLRNSLARYELHVADYQMRRGAYVAAANRAKRVLEVYYGTPATAGALVMLTRAYLALENPELARSSFAVLQYNYPDHPAISRLQKRLREL